MPDKKPEWSDYAYDADSISKRLGIDKEEVRALKDTVDEQQILVTTPGAVGLGISLDFDHPGEQSISGSLRIPGVEITIDANGNGKIDLVGIAKVVTVRKGCFYIQKFYLAGQFLYSDIQKVDSEECNKEPPEPEPEPEPPDPDLDDVDENRKPKPPPLMPSSSNYFDGIYTQTRIVYKKHTGRNSAEEKGKATSIATRLGLHSDPYMDIWKINFSFAGSGNRNANSYSYYCLYPGALTGQGIIVRRNYYYYYYDQFVHNSRYHCRQDEARWGGTITYCQGSDGFVNPDEAFMTVGSFCGGFISGDFEAVKKFLNGGIIESYNYSYYDGSSVTYSHIIETNQIINFADLIPKQKIKNPPITPTIKKMKDDCCDKLEKLLKRLAKYQGLGEKISPINVKDNKIEEKGNKDDNFPMKIPKRWIDREAKPKDDYEVKNMRHLMLSIGIMLDRFEELFNPAGKDKGFPLKKPEEGLWKWLPGDGGDYEAPDPDYDPKKSKDDGKIKNKKLKIESYLDLFRYFLESQIRLELLFPIAQIRDSEISKRLIYPKAPGTIKINDLIQFQELMLLFINKTLGDPSCSVIIKDADPTKAGDQPITFENFDISDMLRKLLRFSVDINSDVDLGNNFGKRTLYQLLSAMQVLVKNHEMTEAIFEDLGMKEEQAFIPVKFFADPYAGAWEAGKGFDPSKVKVENTEAGIEANLEAFLQEKEVEVKVSRRAKEETTDIRDLLAQIGRYAAELAAMGKIPNNPEAIQQAIDKARFELQTESAIRRTDVRQASAAGRVRTKRNKPKKTNRKR